MKNHTELFRFQMKKELQSTLLWLTALVYAVLLIAGQMVYIRHFRLQTLEDYDQIRLRRSADISIPLRGKDRADYYTERIRSILGLTSIPGTETEEICCELRSLLASVEDPGIPDVMDAVSRLKEKHDALKNYSDYTFQNEYIYSDLKEADFGTLREYIQSEGVSFEEAFSRQYAQMAAMIACIAFAVYFSFLFAAETDSSMLETLRVVRHSGKTIWLVKYFAGLAACCVTLIATAFLTYGLVLICNPGTGWGLAGSIFRAMLIYTFPAVLFISAFTVMISTLAKSGFAGLPTGLIAVFLSSVTVVTAGGSREQNLFLSPVFMSTMPYYAPATQELCRKLMLSRLFWIGLSVICVLAGCNLWDRESAGTGKAAKKAPEHESKRNPTRRAGRKSFGRINAKITLSAAALAGSAAFVLAPLILNEYSSVTEAGPAILSNAGWAAILLFSRILSMEYSRETRDTFLMTRVSKLKVTVIRCLQAGTCLIAAESAACLLAMLKTEGLTINLLTACFSRSFIAFTANTFFWGTLSMCLSAVFRRAWAGLGVTSFLHLLLLSKANVNSALNMYFYKIYYSFPERADSTLILSAVIYLAISAVLTLTAVRVFEGRTGRRTPVRRTGG